MLWENTHIPNIVNVCKSGPDPEVKGQRRKEIVNVYDTSSHDN